MDEVLDKYLLPGYSKGSLPESCAVNWECKLYTGKLDLTN